MKNHAKSSYFIKQTLKIIIFQGASLLKFQHGFLILRVQSKTIGSSMLNEIRLQMKPMAEGPTTRESMKTKRASMMAIGILGLNAATSVSVPTSLITFSLLAQRPSAGITAEGLQTAEGGQPAVASQNPTQNVAEAAGRWRDRSRGREPNEKPGAQTGMS